MLEIQYYSDAQLRDLKVIQHQSTLVVGDSVDRFRVHHDSVKSN